MADTRPTLTLAHSPDPDDVFMWWPITGKIRADVPRGAPHDHPTSPSVIDTGKFRYIAVADDIEVLNRRAITPGEDTPYDITALSFRAWADCRAAYRLTACGSSFGDGYGPKIVRRADQSNARAEIACPACLAKPGVRFAVPGMRTTAFMLLGLVMGPTRLRRAIDEGRVTEMPFERVIPAVASGDFEVGLVIHEGQVTFADAGLALVADVGAWWKQSTGLPTPLGGNALRRDLDARFGPGSADDVAATLARSIAHASTHRDESIDYTMPFALANIAAGGHAAERPTRERVTKYIDMYVNRFTADMGEEGVESLRRLFAAGAEAGLCPAVGAVDVLGY